MYKCTKYKPNIIIDKDPGIYIFAAESGIGKTYMYKLFNNIISFGENVFAYSYVDECKYRNLETMLKNKKYDVILIDRYDLYYNEEYNKLFEEASKDSIVLVDLKDNDKFISKKEQVCLMDFTEDTIKVH